MKRAALLLSLSLAALSAQAEQWLLVVEGDVYVYHGQRGSALITKSTVSFIVRQRRTDGTGGVELFRALVKRDDCAQQSGTLLLTDLSFKTEKLRTDFAFGAGNVGSVLAERVCNELRAEQPAKGSGVQL